MIPKTGLSTKDFIAPDSFDFRFSRLFRVGTTWGAASYLQILASELSDKLLAELLEMDAEMNHHSPYPNRRSGRRRKIYQGQSLRH